MRHQSVGRIQKKKLKVKAKHDKTQQQLLERQVTCLRENMTVSANVKSLWPKERERRKEEFKGRIVTNEDLVNSYRIYYDETRMMHKTVVVSDKLTKDVVLVVKFHPFSKMSTDDHNNFQRVVTIMHKHALLSYPCTTNSAMHGGTMYSIGWRAGTDAGFSGGRFVLNNKVQRQIEAVQNYIDTFHELKEVETFYCNGFADLSPSLFELVMNDIKDTGVPSFADAEIDVPELVDLDDEDYDIPLGNLLVLTYDLLNVPHEDNDHGVYIYGIMFPCTTEGALASKLDGYDCDGGHFFVDNYVMFVDLASCDGYVEMIWRSTEDYHCTTISKVKDGFTKCGSSVQINSKFVNIIKRIKRGELSCDKIKGIRAMIKQIKTKW